MSDATPKKQDLVFSTSAPGPLVVSEANLNRAFKYSPILCSGGHTV